MNLPLHYKPAAWQFRFASSMTSLMLFGSVAAVDQYILADTYEDGHFVRRLFMFSIISLIWATSVLWKSIGNAVWSIEVRALNGGSLPLIRRALRSFHLYIFGYAILVPIPVVSLVITIAVIVMVLANSVLALLTRRSLSDRIVGADLYRLDLPDHLKPRLAGIRIT